jgi:predicted O-linked N-acetylglucosamine transferase (SPINDLY family)
MTSSDALALAFQQHQAGNLDQAERTYREILQKEPAHAQALRLLGCIFQARGQLADAVACFERALAAQPDLAEAANDLGVALAQSGRLADSIHYFRQALHLAPQLAMVGANLAEALYRVGTQLRNQGHYAQAIEHYQESVRLRPHHAELHNDLGVAWAMSGRPAEAMTSFQEAQRLKPDYADPPNNLGIVLAKQGRSAEALELFRRALALKPDYPEAHYNLGTALRNLDRCEEAVPCFRQALHLRPQYADAHANLGLALWHLGRNADAIAHYQQALNLRPVDPDTLNNLGLALRDQGRLSEALSCYQQALNYRPQAVATLTNLGNVLKDLGRFDEAIACYRQVLTLQPDYADAHNSLGNALLEQGQHDGAEASYQNALRLKPDYAEAHNNLGNALADQGQVEGAVACYREALSLKPGYASAHSNLLMHLNYLPDIDPATVFAEHCRWEAVHGASGPTPVAYTNQPDPERRLRVGYITPDLNRHPVARFFVEPILAHHNSASVETICYAEVPSAMAARVQTLAGRWRAIRGLTDAMVADLVCSDAVDILVDLAGHTVNCRLGVFTYRPAPIQVTALGYPNTTGLKSIHYRLTDAIADPPDEPVRHTEELVRLPGPFCCYAPIEGVPPVAPAPVQRNGYVTFGSPHHLAKLNARVLDLWCAILNALPTARLLIFRHTLRGRTRDNLERSLMERGLDRRRFDLRQATDMQQGFLGFYGSVDITLDAFPWSSHTTACDSLWMGVPLITLASPHHAGRMAASVLSAVGLADWVTTTPEAYQALALRKAADHGRLIQLRAELRERMRSSPLCDGKRYTQGLEKVYRSLWQRWCARATLSGL